MKTTINPQEFAIAWQSSSSIEEVAQRLKRTSTKSLLSYKYFLKKKGVNLKDMRQSSIDVAAINGVIASISSNQNDLSSISTSKSSDVLKSIDDAPKRGGLTEARRAELKRNGITPDDEWSNLTCKVCGDAFQSKNPSDKYCNLACEQKAK